MAMEQSGYIRIGALSKRVGVSPELLRAWERRYDLLRPDRSPGGFRLYSDADVARVQAMQEHLARGLSAAEAARLALEFSAAETAVDDGFTAPVLDASLANLRQGLAGFDEAGAHSALDRLLAAFGLETVLRDVVLPLLRELGESWARGDTTVAQEHFASQLIRGRLLALARGWDRGTGPRALLAAPPGEMHDLGLIVFGLALRDRGWRVTFLGADTPVDTILDTANRLAPQLVVVVTLLESRLGAVADELRALTEAWAVAVAGAGASEEIAALIGADYVPDGPLEAAERFTAALAVPR